jgi:hypothetical protein
MLTVCRALGGNLLDSGEIPTGLFAPTPNLQTLGLNNMGLVFIDAQLFSGLSALRSMYVG